MANAYLTAEQFFAFYDARTMLQLSGDQGSPQGNPANLTRILDAAAGVLDSTLAGRVALPLAAVPDFLRMMVADLAAKRLYVRRGNVPKELLATCEAAEKWMADFRDGAVSIPDVGPTQLPVLQDSTYLNGESRWDRVYGQRPSETGPSRGV
jgi:phage gp36-like protein